ncbi:ATP-dependent exoDNAse (exonuclease V) beta subunit [Flavobacteriaceae bacterium MAR_2010_72]|nr:ATP-dependent exoDNAse (exonuclease V) beta subunit [Flavobacteriaceae bacterium MAR_2010_72]TVZ58392.1 ATP-dependent exoDNAse (exonuclease V) beta subunit [Flavobacteriaceae bacterium MAR_2010_105]
MSKTSAFTIYNASAGSGKTHTVVKNYLKILFQSKSALPFKNILALTFTNKAVGEMKERIIETLKTFSNESILESGNTMFNELAKELEMDTTLLHKKSQRLLLSIVHNYAAFDISTIDKFNHKLIRTFAYDLKLPLNFEVELDTHEMLAKAVDSLIDKAGTDEELTKVLVEFAIEKADDDRSWDVTYDFNAIAKLLIDENEIPFVELIADKTLEDFKNLKNIINERLKTIASHVVQIAKKTLTLIEECGLEHNDFSGQNGYVPSYFLKLTQNDFTVTYDKVWMEKIETDPLYPKTSTPEDIKSIIDRIQPQIVSSFTTTKKQIIQYKFLKNTQRNLTPVSVLNEINKTLKVIKDDENKVLISEFNSIISKEINQQPAPFIYERIGEKFKHYFIDEFQDTSVLQWQNLVPLIDNALAGETLKGETGSVMLVGDAKQAIYRWRGGRAEQFIELYNKTNHPLVIEQNIENLPKNYRSTKQVVQFNNSFFKHISGFVFSNPEHQQIFEASSQNKSKDEDGYVELHFLDTTNEDTELLYCEKILETLNRVQANGFSLNDICIVTRKVKEGIAIAEFLSSQNIAIVSSETLLLKNSPEVAFIVNVMTLVLQPSNKKVKMEVLTYLDRYLLNVDDSHSFYEELVVLEGFKFFKALESRGFYFNLDVFITFPIYEAVETIVRAFHLNKDSNAYIQYFLDEVLDYSLKNDVDLASFLEFWERKKEKLSVVSLENNGAVTIMTIHKSKGLEYPIIIFPFANQDIYFDKSPKVWFPVDEQQFNGFNYLYLNLNKDLESYSILGAQMYHSYRAQLELDSINLLYVALTRAAQQLYVISELDLTSKGSEKQNLYSGLLIHYLKEHELWDINQSTYSFGNPNQIEVESEKVKTDHFIPFISTARQQHNLNIVTSAGYLWDTSQEKAIERGNLIHLIMSQIKVSSDVDFVFDTLISLGHINSSQSEILRPFIMNIVQHEKLIVYFDHELTIYNERDIITDDGKIVRPDRIVINKTNEAVVIDYKTGHEDKTHESQLEDYKQVIENMGLKVLKKILIYIDDEIQVKEL